MEFGELDENLEATFIKTHQGKDVFLRKMVATWAIMTFPQERIPGVTWYDERWCYSNPLNAAAAAFTWAEEEDEPRGWIKHYPSQRYNEKLMN
jgi:hypothetical protein